MKEELLAFIQQRTPREKAMGAVAIITLASMMLYPLLVAPVREAFARQSKQLEDLSMTYNVTPAVLTRYAKLLTRRQDLEKFYSGVDLSADPLSYIEKLLRDTAKASGPYNVTPREGSTLGERYVAKIFLVNFQTTSMENLSAFLKELTTGTQPMLLSAITLDKRGAADTITVQLEVSGFEALSK